MNPFPYTMEDVLRLEGISYKPGKSQIRVCCPNCNKKKMTQELSIDLKEEFFNCYGGCGLHGRFATNFYAYLHGLSSKEAYENIMSELGLSNEKIRYEPRKRIVEEIKEEPQAIEVDPSVKDKTYSQLLSMLKLSEKHENDLLDRGFTKEEILLCGYSTYPKANDEGYTEQLFAIPKRLISKQCELYGVPGFHRTRTKGVWTMMKNKGGIMVPYRNFFNQITGIQIRKDNEDLIRDESGKLESKYFSFSSAGYKDGCKSSAQAHFACDFTCDKENNLQHPLISKGIITITEGAMKAELAFRVSGIPFIGFPGVSVVIPALKEIIPLLKDIGVHTIAIAYDMDRVTNINVSECLYKVKQFILDQGMNCQEITWSKEIVNLDGTHQMINIDEDFIFTPETLTKAILKSDRTIRSKDFVDDILSRCIQIGKKNIYFAFSNSKEITEETKELFHTLTKSCKNRDFTCKSVFWSLKLKGVDDYFACKYRNIDYTTK